MIAAVTIDIVVQAIKGAVAITALLIDLVRKNPEVASADEVKAELAALSSAQANLQSQIEADWAEVGGRR